MEPGKELRRSPLFVAKVLLLIVSFVAAVLGFGFCVWKDNYYGTTSFLFLLLVSPLLLHMNVRHMKGQLFEDYDRPILKCRLLLGCFLLPVSVIFSVFLLVMGIKYETEFIFIYNNSYFALVPCLAANIWYAVLVYDIRNFIRLYDEQHGTTSNIR